MKDIDNVYGIRYISKETLKRGIQGWGNGECLVILL